MCSRTINNIRSIYDIYFYKIIKFYYPIVEKLIFLQNRKIVKYNICKTYTDCDFFYKFQNVEYHNNIYYNLGIIYHTTNQNIDKIIDKEIVFFEEDVDSVKLILKSSATDNDYILIDEKFVNSILNFATKKSKLSLLIYYYLQKYLSNNDQIVNVEFEINNKYISVNHESLLEEIVSSIEVSL